MRKPLDLRGQKFGRLTAIRPTKKRFKSNVVWLCRCSCGKNVLVGSGNLSSGNTKSCGCLKSEKTIIRNTKHGFAYHPLYTVLKNMKRRCYNPKTWNYKNYGGRGITICDEWLNDKKNFFEWSLANGWKKNLMIDRRDNGGNYNPENCHFATPLKQANNTRHLKLFIAYGPCGQIKITKNQSAFARKWGLTRGEIGKCLCKRRKQYKGWRFEFLTLRRSEKNEKGSRRKATLNDVSE